MLVFTPKNGQNCQNLTKNGVFGLTVVPNGFWQQRWAVAETIFFAVLTFLFRKKPFLTIFGPFKMPF